MNIGFIGWGSLIRSHSGLRITGEWHKDGPFLPVEFARISTNNTLTLVLFPDAPEVETLWANTKFEKLPDAIEALRVREKTPNVDQIGFFDRVSNTYRCKSVPEVLPKIRAWISQKNLEAVVWTDLKSNFEKKSSMVFNDENVLNYLGDLSAGEFEEAERYVTNVPEQIDTTIRRVLRRKLGWRSLREFGNGFWLDRHTFIMADDVQLTDATKSLESSNSDKDSSKMLILSGALEMTVDNAGKILGVEKKGKYGLWLDDAKKSLKEVDLNKE